MAGEYYLKFDGIEGSSQSKTHSKYVDIVKFSTGSRRNVLNRLVSDVAGRGQFDLFTFVHSIDAATPKFHSACLTGNEIKFAELEVCNSANGQEKVYFYMKLEHIKIVRVKVITEGYDVPMEKVELTVGKITWRTTLPSPDKQTKGSVETTFDQVRNQ